MQSISNMPSQTIQMIMLQHIPLYVASICSIAAITLSVRAYSSTQFASLEEPIRLGPYIRNIDHIGLSLWEACAINENALLDILSYEGSDDGELNADPSALVDELAVSTSMTTTTDLPRNTTTHVLTTYHYRPHSIKRSTGLWFEEPDHDDVLVSGDFPFNDDDAYEMSLPMENWSCHLLQISSRSMHHDTKWVISRVSFTLGAILGIFSTCLLIALIVCRIQYVLKLQRQQQDVLQNGNMLHESQSNSKQSERPNRTLAIRHSASQANEQFLLDTNTSGYKTISICFLCAYLLQSATFLFLDSETCQYQACSISTGGQELIGSCVLWVISGLLTLCMLNIVRENRRKLRKFNKRTRREEELIKQELQLNGDAGLLMKTEKDDEDFKSLSSIEKYDAGSVLNTTMDAEYSDVSLEVSEEEALIDDQLVLPRDLSKVETEGLRRRLESKLNAAVVSEDDEEDIENLLDYIIDMIESRKSVGYIVEEAAFLEVPVCDANAARKLGECIAIYFNELPLASERDCNSQILAENEESGMTLGDSHL